jgi:signal transduction histidine kinase
MKRTKLRKYGLIFGIWTVYGLIMALSAHFKAPVTRRELVPWGQALWGEMSYAYIWFLLTPLALKIGERWPIRSERWVRRALLHLAAAYAVSFVGTFLAWVLHPLGMGQPPMALSSVVRNTFITVDFGAANYALIILFQHAREYYVRYEESRVRTARLEAQLATAQLQALKMQLHPHFLFNTLHAISELVHEDPNAAESMITRLSDFLRLTLENVGVTEVTLREEMDFLKRYLEIEKMRFDDQLDVDFEVEPAALEAKVPNLILQPLVENAIKHGLSRRSDTGLLRIGAQRNKAMLCMKVFDNGPGVNPEDRKQLRRGVGLTNTQERLKRLYEQNYLLALMNAPAGGFEVTIQIPFRLT